MKTRKLAAAVAITLGVIALAGCGSTSASPSTGGAGTQPTTVPPVTTAGGGSYGY